MAKRKKSKANPKSKQVAQADIGRSATTSEDVADLTQAEATPELDPEPASPADAVPAEVTETPADIAEAEAEAEAGPATNSDAAEVSAEQDAAPAADDGAQADGAQAAQEQPAEASEKQTGKRRKKRTRNLTEQPTETVAEPSPQSADPDEPPLAAEGEAIAEAAAGEQHGDADDEQAPTSATDEAGAESAGEDDVPDAAPADVEAASRHATGDDTVPGEAPPQAGEAGEAGADAGDAAAPEGEAAPLPLEGSEGEGQGSPEGSPEDGSLEGDRLENIIESLLFASDKALSLSDLKRLLGDRDGKKISAAVQALIEKRRYTGIQVVTLSTGWHLRTHVDNAAWVSKLLVGKPVRLSRAMMETLAIVAYRQPVTRPEIDDIRGVDCGPVLKTLLDRGLVRIIGKKEEVGRPMLYGTTPEFLRVFNLSDLTGLPTLREFYDLSAEDQSKVDAEAPQTPSATTAKPDVALNAVARGALTPEEDDADPLLDELDEASKAAKQALGELEPNQEEEKTDEAPAAGAPGDENEKKRPEPGATE